MTGRELLEHLGPLLAPTREIRFRTAEDFVDVTDVELEQAARALRALGYSCNQGAAKLDAVRAGRPS